MDQVSQGGLSRTADMLIVCFSERRIVTLFSIGLKVSIVTISFKWLYTSLCYLAMEVGLWSCIVKRVNTRADGRFRFRGYEKAPETPSERRKYCRNTRKWSLKRTGMAALIRTESCSPVDSRNRTLSQLRRPCSSSNYRFVEVGGRSRICVIVHSLGMSGSVLEWSADGWDDVGVRESVRRWGFKHTSGRCYAAVHSQTADRQVDFLAPVIICVFAVCPDLPDEKLWRSGRLYLCV